MSSMVGEGSATAPVRNAERMVRVLAAVTLAVLVAACAQTKSFITSDELPERSGTLRVLLIPPDVELAELTTAGLQEPNAAWTATAKSNVDWALAAILEEKAAKLIRYQAPASGGYDDAHLQAIKLHSAVGKTILVHKYLPPMALPTKKETFDWSLGEAVGPLRETYDADYALFVYFRDSFSSGGRVALIFVGALLGVGIPGGQQVGFASLVDLRTGNVVWFNRLASGTGDLRKADLARGASDNLLSDFPL
jgi:hypothetical protein